MRSRWVLAWMAMMACGEDTPSGQDAATSDALAAVDGSVPDGAMPASPDATALPDASAPIALMLRGTAQKGPFIVGSSVEAHLLGPTLDPTGSVLSSQITSNEGSFTVSSPPTGAPFVEVVVQGYFYDEIDDALSGGPLTLRAIVPTSSTAAVRVNLLTTVVNDRIKALVRGGMSFDAAATQAKIELFRVFDLDGGQFPDLTAVDLTLRRPGDVALVALSATMLQYARDRSQTPAERVAQLSVLLATFGQDLELDGVVTATSALGWNLAGAAHRYDPTRVMENLDRYYASLGVSVTVPPIGAALRTFAARWPWRFGPRMPHEFSHPTLCATSTRVYSIGGYDYENGNPQSLVYELDPSAGRWVRRANMPTPRWISKCAVVDDIVYVFGGRGANSRYHQVVEAYDPRTDQWSARAPIPEWTESACAVVAHQKVFFIRGSKFSNPRSWVYDPALDRWSDIPPMMHARAGVDCAAIGDSIFALGGSVSTASTTVERFDLPTSTWSTEPPLPHLRYGVMGAVGGEIYRMSASDFQNQAPTMNEFLDPTAGVWRQRTPMDNHRVGAGFSSFVFQGEVWVYNRSDSHTRELEIYDPSRDRDP